jgi:hypothetical protein
MRAREFVINVPITIKINGDAEPEVGMDQDEPELDTMVPPLQQKLEIAKRNSGLPNVFDEDADEDEPLE